MMNLIPVNILIYAMEFVKLLRGIVVFADNEIS